MNRYVYLIKNQLSERYKIGVAKNPEKRIKSLQTGSDEKIVILQTFNSQFPFLLETALHKQYYGVNYRGEWFELNPEDVEQFLNNCKKKEENFRLLEENNSWFQQAYLK